jgi:transcriptional regulator of acetoin/glycerol metabolism
MSSSENSLPSDRVRTLVEIVKGAWAPFTDDERIDFLAMVNRDRRAALDAHAIDKMITATGNIGLAAKNLGVSRRTLQKRMRDFGMEPGRAGRRVK